MFYQHHHQPPLKSQEHFVVPYLSSDVSSSMGLAVKYRHCPDCANCFSLESIHFSLIESIPKSFLHPHFLYSLLLCIPLPFLSTYFILAVRILFQSLLIIVQNSQLYNNVSLDRP